MWTVGLQSFYGNRFVVALRRRAVAFSIMKNRYDSYRVLKDGNFRGNAALTVPICPMV